MAAQRKLAEREEDLVIIADLYKRGWSMRKIADIVTDKRPYSISHVTVKNDLDEVFNRWVVKQQQFISKFITVQLEKLEAIENQLWIDYNRSRQPKKTFKEKKKANLQKITDTLRKKQNKQQLDDESLDSIFNDAIKQYEGDIIEEPAIDFTDLTGIACEIEQEKVETERDADPRYMKLLLEVFAQKAKLVGWLKEKEDGIEDAVIVVVPPPVVTVEQILAEQEQGLLETPDEELADAANYYAKKEVLDLDSPYSEDNSSSY